MNKKGISPLIGTVLLVAIVIAMILIIMPWVTKTIKTQQTKTTEALTAMDCMDKLRFELLLGTGDAIIVDNTGEADIMSLNIRKYDVDGKVTPVPKLEGAADADGNPTVFLEAFSTSPKTSVICDTYKIEAFATIKSGAKSIVCADNTREVYCS